MAAAACPPSDRINGFRFSGSWDVTPTSQPHGSPGMAMSSTWRCNVQRYGCAGRSVNIRSVSCLFFYILPVTDKGNHE